MRIRVAVTDNRWVNLLKSQEEVGEVNFWQPSSRIFRALSPGEPILFKLNGPEDSIVGGGFFAYSTSLPYTAAWEAFGRRNGVATLAEMEHRIERYRRESLTPQGNIGCVVLKDPFFWDKSQWIPTPSDFTKHIVQGKNYEGSTEVGQVLWERVNTQIQLSLAGATSAQSHVAGLIGSDGLPLKKESAEHCQILTDLSCVNDRLLELLARKPELLRKIGPRKFEEVVAELLARQGYEVQLTPTSRDGGFDIYAAKNDGLGQFLYLVECKRLSPPAKVGVGIIRALYGTVLSQRATAGVVVTTSFFTADANAYRKSIQYQMQLQDFLTLQEWLANMGFGQSRPEF